MPLVSGGWGRRRGGGCMEVGTCRFESQSQFQQLSSPWRNGGGLSV